MVDPGQSAEVEKIYYIHIKLFFSHSVLLNFYLKTFLSLSVFVLFDPSHKYSDDVEY